MKKRFTKEDLQFIIDNYQKLSNQEIADFLGRTRDTITAYGAKLGLKKNKDLVGKKFHRLIVISKDKLENHKQYWKCICDCGKETIVPTNSLNSGYTRSCGCLRKDLLSSPNNVGIITGVWFNNLERNAHSRNIAFDLTPEYLNSLIQKQNFTCALSGLKIDIKKGRFNRDTTASLDRIDNNKGYIEGNVQFLHKHINYMKWTHTQKYFVELCKLIVNFQGKYANSTSNIS